MIYVTHYVELIDEAIHLISHSFFLPFFADNANQTTVNVKKRLIILGKIKIVVVLGLLVR